MPTDVDIWDDGAEPLLADPGPLWSLWKLLGLAHWPETRLHGGLDGWAKRSKLLGAKRPRLMPILDKKVRAALPESKDYWQDFREALRDESLRQDVADGTSAAPPGLSLLRRADVVLWMAAQGGD